MRCDDTLIWRLSTKGTLAELSEFIQSGRQPHRPRHGGGNVAKHILRSKDGLNEVMILEATGDATALAQAVREHWAVLRDRGLAAAQPVKIFAASDAPHLLVYAFRWKNPGARLAAREDGDAVAAMAGITSAGRIRDRLDAADEVYQGFEYKSFPATGGVELLRGKCTCTVEMDGLPGPIELDGQNGFVIMHRGPRYRIKDDWIMPVTILAHGADSPNPLANDPRFADNPDLTSMPIRVEQNTELPQFGIIRAQGKEAHFPAVAMWIVHWRIHTPLGTIITDPKVPLVFGPTHVRHYPPVGTEFQSAIGPVDVYNVESGKVVGKLTPGELTAFDIVVTMDDEIPSVMDAPAKYHVDLFNEYIGDPAMRLESTGLRDDYRVPSASRGQTGRARPS